MHQTKHQCFIKPVDPEDDKPKLKNVNANEVGARHTVRTDEDGSCWVEELPPLLAYADYGAVTDDDGVQTPILVCYEDEDEDETHSFYGPTSTDDLFDHLDALSVDEYGDERRVIVTIGTVLSRRCTRPLEPRRTFSAPLVTPSNSSGSVSGIGW